MTNTSLFGVDEVATKTVSTVDLVRTVLKNSNIPLKAKEIAKIIRTDHGFRLYKKDVNSILYNELYTAVTKNENFQWSL
jgi:hypothetical protein